ncbi:hypothetical protein Tco_1219824 [Tanacetum coccineum]
MDGGTGSSRHHENDSNSFSLKLGMQCNDKPDGGRRLSSLRDGSGCVTDWLSKILSMANAEQAPAMASPIRTDEKIMHAIDGKQTASGEFTASSTIPGYYFNNSGIYCLDYSTTTGPSLLLQLLIPLLNLSISWGIQRKSCTCETPGYNLLGYCQSSSIDYAERMWEEFTQSIHTFTEDKRKLAQSIIGKRIATLSLSQVSGKVVKKRTAKSSKRLVDEFVDEGVTMLLTQPLSSQRHAICKRCCMRAYQMIHNFQKGPLPHVVIRETLTPGNFKLPEVPGKGKEGKLGVRNKGPKFSQPSNSKEVRARLNNTYLGEFSVPNVVVGLRCKAGWRRPGTLDEGQARSAPCAQPQLQHTTTTKTNQQQQLSLPPQPQQGFTAEKIYPSSSRMDGVELEEFIATLVEENQALESRLDKQGNRIHKLETMDLTKMIRGANALFVLASRIPTPCHEEFLLNALLEENYDKGHADHGAAYEATAGLFRRDESEDFDVDKRISGASGTNWKPSDLLTLLRPTTSVSSLIQKDQSNRHCKPHIPDDLYMDEETTADEQAISSDDERPCSILDDGRHIILIVGLEQLVHDQLGLQKNASYDIAELCMVSIIGGFKDNDYTLTDSLRRRPYGKRDFKNIVPSRNFKIVLVKSQQKTSSLGIESYQTQINLTKPRWEATGFEFKHDYTVIDSPRAVTFRDRYGVQMIMRDEHQILDEGKDVDRSKDFMFAIQLGKRLKTRRIFQNLESFVGGRIEKATTVLRFFPRAILPEHPSDTIEYPDEDGIPSRATQQALGRSVLSDRRLTQPDSGRMTKPYCAHPIALLLTVYTDQPKIEGWRTRSVEANSPPNAHTECLHKMKMILKESSRSYKPKRQVRKVLLHNVQNIKDIEESRLELKKVKSMK